MTEVYSKATELADVIAREIDGNFIVNEKEIAANAGVIATYLAQVLLQEQSRWVYCPRHGRKAIKPSILGEDNEFTCTVLGCDYVVRATEEK